MNILFFPRPRQSDRWRTSLWHIPDDASVRHALLVGIGDGSGAIETRRRFKNAHVTVLETDREKINGVLSSRRFPKRDLPEVVGATDRAFDLVLVEPDAPIAPEQLARALGADGFLILCAGQDVARIPAVERVLSRHAAWHCKDSAVALFRHFGQGRIGEPVPAGFVHQMQSPDYLLGGWPADATNARLVGTPECWGMRWHYGPMWIEAYTSDVPPAIDETEPSRMVIWQPITKLGRPAGWHHSWIQMNPQQHGFADVTGKEEYWKEWSDHAQRQRKKWLKDGRYDTVDVSYEDFVAAYNRTGKLPTMRKDFVRLLGRRIDRHGMNVRLFGSRDKETGEIISGLAVCDLPDVSVSMHLIAYIHPKHEKTAVGTGIIDHWYRHCQATGIRFPHFGLVWAPGDPNSWKGYSKFKRQFNLHLLRYPMPLLKFVRQKPRG